jgi:hypothetical protein
MNIPKNAPEITPEWLGEALGAKVATIDVTPINVGGGLRGSLCRLDITYVDGTGPKSLVAKFPAEGDGRQVAELFGMYRREVRFYEQLSQRTEVPNARCYYSALDDETQQFVLLLGDHTGGRVVDQLDGCEFADATLAVRRLADMHASFWEDGEVASADWIGQLSDSPFPETAVFSYQRSWGTAKALFGDVMPDAIKELGDRFDTLLPELMRRLSAEPTTMSHGNYRLASIFFADRDITVCDWQLVDRSRGARDLAHFIVDSLTPANRAAHEIDLVAAYASRLLANGVTDYDLRTCWEDYRIAVLFNFVYGIVGAGAIDATDTRRVALVRAMIERSVAAIVELDCLALIEDI